MNFVNKSQIRSVFENKTVAIVGSGPGVLDNEPGLIDEHEVVVRVNNFRLFAATGVRTDVYYSFFGNSIKKEAVDLIAGGVQLCMCKCPNAKVIESEWHRVNGKMDGVDFRGIYERRKDWWFCDTYIPTLHDFLALFESLGRHIPTTGFAAIREIMECNPAYVYLTGFDLFRSGLHNVNEPWRRKNTGDPIGHVPEVELQWLRENKKMFAMDKRLTAILSEGEQCQTPSTTNV